MFARAGVTLSNSSHRRIRTLCASPVIWREYVSVSSCGNCQYLRSKLSSRRRFRSACTYYTKGYSTSSTSSQVSYANSRRIHERWREKTDVRQAPSLESVHTEMIQVLTYKMERMILDESHSYLPLTVHSANSQSTSEEQWTDFDAISVISAPDTARKLIQNPDHVNISFPATSWDVELLQFKHSVLRDKKKLRISSKAKDIFSTFAKSSETLTSLNRLPHQNDHAISQTFSSHQESPQSSPHQNEQHVLRKMSARQGQTLDKSFVSSSLSEPSVRITEDEVSHREDIDSRNLLKHLHTRKPLEKMLQKSTSNEVKHSSGSSVHDLKFEEEDYGKESINIERLDNEVSSQEVTAADDLVLGTERVYAVDARLEPLEDAVSEDDLDTESVHSAPPVFLSKKKKSRLAKQESNEKGSTKLTKTTRAVKPLDVEKKIAYFNQDLLAYVEACVQAGMVKFQMPK
ncbi:uncharacterized protein LOC135475788 [Liolophura sinensis]|uniref:uncharacterized protein LOC135475788 n=1 Tax=Liolophura sinensis TaxID=3198878 RepID=UPI003158D27E